MEKISLYLDGRPALTALTRQRSDTSFMPVTESILTGEEVAAGIDIVFAGLVGNGGVSLLHQTRKRTMFKHTPQTGQLAKDLLLGTKIILFESNTLDVALQVSPAGQVRQNTRSRIDDKPINFVLAPPKLVHRGTISFVCPAHGRSCYGLGTWKNGLPCNIHVRTKNALYCVEVDRTMKEPAKTAVLSGDKGDNFFHVHTVTTQGPEDLLAQRNSAANDVLRRLVMLNVKRLFENGFQRVRKR